LILSILTIDAILSWGYNQKKAEFSGEHLGSPTRPAFLPNEVGGWPAGRRPKPLPHRFDEATEVRLVLRLSLSARQCLLAVSALVLLSGCNLFSGIHQDGNDSNASVLVADGKAALGRGDYANAAEYFRLAIQNNSRSSEARMGYAEAYLKSRGYNFGVIVNMVLQSNNNSNGSSGTTTLAKNYINPQDWGCKTSAELKAFFDTLVATLDPIADGQTDGPYAWSDVNVNLSVGFFYLLRAAAQVQDVSMTFQLQEISKSSTSAATLGIPQSLFDQLPDQFYWLVNSPPITLLNALNNDMNAGISRMQTAADHCANPDIINNAIKSFKSLQIQTQP
jgi:hypothetical protein